MWYFYLIGIGLGMVLLAFAAGCINLVLFMNSSNGNKAFFRHVFATFMAFLGSVLLATGLIAFAVDSISNLVN